MTTLSKGGAGGGGSINRNPNVVKFSEIFPLEEITHFDRQSSSQNGNGNVVAGSSSASFGFDPSAPRSIYSNNEHRGGGKTVYHGGGASLKNNPFVIDHGGESDDSDDSSNIEVFTRAENYDVDSDILDVSDAAGATGDVQQQQKKKKEKIKSLDSTKTTTTTTTTSAIEQKNSDGGSSSSNKFKSSESEENLVFGSSSGFLSFNDSFVLNVKRADVILDAIVLFVIVAELVLDISLVSWYYRDGQIWAATITALFLLVGAGSALQQFNLLSQDQIKRLFNQGKRIRILVNCFPPLATILSSFQCVKIGYKARNEAMLCGQYLEIENFSKRLSKTQSFFQAAPQATLQLLLFIESIDNNSIGFLKGFFCICSIIVSLTVMTNASLPSKAETHDHLRKTTQRPSTRIFVGIRMFSSFASRTMAVTSLLIGCRCLFGPTALISGTIIAISIVLVPRVIFTLIEFVRLVIIGRRSRDAGRIHQLSCYDIFTGYVATILFPVGDPVWIFLYIWSESALFVIVGNIMGWSFSCLINAVNATYTGTFLVLFIIIPILVPFARASIKKRQSRNAADSFQNRHHHSQSTSIHNVQMATTAIV